MSLFNIKRGDKVFVVDRGYRRADATVCEWMEVSSAGPKYITVGGGHKQAKFHRDSGAVVTEYTARQFAYASEDEWIAVNTRAGLEDKARKLLYRPNLQAMSDASLAALIALLEVA